MSSGPLLQADVTKAESYKRANQLNTRNALCDLFKYLAKLLTP